MRLWNITNSGREYVQRTLSPANLGEDPDMVVLTFLMETPDSKYKEIADECDLDQDDLAYTLAKLFARDYVSTSSEGG